VFPESYERTSFQVTAQGKPVDVGLEAEEYALIYHCYTSKHEVDARFKDNFFKDWRKLLPPTLRQLPVAEFAFGPSKRSAEPCKEYRKRLAAGAKDRPPKRCMATVDGTEEAFTPCTVEGPGLFLGRGDHPARGRIKRRIRPEDVTLNLERSSAAPAAPEGHRWRSVVHQPSSWWLAKWSDPVTGKDRYVWLAPDSHRRSLNDLRKFEFARKLDSAKVNSLAASLVEARDPRKKQMGVVLHLLETLVLRIGSEASNERSFGLTTLLGKHIQLADSKGTATFSFPGKDGVMYKGTVPLPAKVYPVLKQLKQAAGADRPVFPLVTSALVNKTLHALLPGLTARVFRTHHASQLYEQTLLRLEQRELRKGKKETRKHAERRALEVLRGARETTAELCNHRKHNGGQLETSTTVNNYLDPRVSVAFAKRHDIPIQRVFTAQQRARFAWALTAPASFMF
jgi:DNA topoisomerase-1